MPDAKPCTGCEEVKPLDEYHRNRTKPDGRQVRCKTCVVEDQRRYREANRDKIAESQRRYREANRDKVAEDKRRYYEENRNKELERRRRYREANRDKALERDRRYYEENRDKRLESQRRYREENRDKRREYHRQYREENREFRNRSSARRIKEKQDNTALTATRNGKPWTPAEDDVLTADDGRNLFAKALLLGRTYASCVSRRGKLNHAAA